MSQKNEKEEKNKPIISSTSSTNEVKSGFEKIISENEKNKNEDKIQNKEIITAINKVISTGEIILI
jgi:hypothetical protein